MMPYTRNTAFNHIPVPDASDTDYVQPLLDRNEVGINSPANGSPTSLWNLIDFDSDNCQNEPTNTTTSFPSEPSGSTLTVPMQTISLIPETPIQSSIVIPEDPPYHHNEHTILEHSQLDTAGIEDWLASQSQENEGSSATWTQLFDDFYAGKDNQNSLVTPLDHQSLPPSLEHSRLQPPVVPFSSNNNDDTAVVSFTNYLQVPQAPTSVGERESSPAGLIFGPSFSRAQTPVSTFPGGDGRLTPINTSVEALRHLSQTNQPLPSPGSKRSRQATVDSTETVTQGHCSNPASGSTTKPPRKRQKPKDSALVQTGLDPLTIDNVECSTTDDSEAISRAIRIVQNDRTIRDLVLYLDSLKARHHHDDDSAILYEYLHPDSHETSGVELLSGSHSNLQQSQKALAVYASTPSRSLQVFESQTEEGIDILYPDASIGLSERQIMKQRAADPVTVENAPGPSQTSWNAPTSTSLIYNHEAFSSTLTNTSSSAASCENMSLAGTSYRPSPAGTYLTTPASSYAPLSAHTPTNPILKPALSDATTTNQFGLVTKPQARQHETIWNHETPLPTSSSSHARTTVTLADPKQPQRQHSAMSNSGMQYGQSIFKSKYLPQMRRQTQPTPAPASIGLDITQTERVSSIPSSAIAAHPENPMPPPNFILIPQEIRFNREMGVLCDDLKEPIRFRYEGATYDGVRLSDAASTIKTRLGGLKPRICDSNKKFNKKMLPQNTKLRINWPGYAMVEMQCQVNRNKLGILVGSDRQRILEYVANQVVKMMEKLSEQEFNPEPNQERYRIGTPVNNKLERWVGGLSYHDILITCIIPKSAGVWQPELWFDTSSFGSNQQ